MRPRKAVRGLDTSLALSCLEGDSMDKKQIEQELIEAKKRLTDKKTY